jgi:hypothetical protein
MPLPNRLPASASLTPANPQFIIDLSGEFSSPSVAARQHMSLFSKILVGFIFVASVTFLVLSAYALKTHVAWEEAAASYEKPLATSAQREKLLSEGDDSTTPPTPSVGALQARLHKVMVGRGRVWRGCTPQRAGAGNAVAVEVPDPDPHQIEDKAILHIIEEGPVGAYLGEFKVVGLADKTISLAPTMTLFPTQEKALAASRTTWSLYERLPTDRHDVYQGLDQAQISAMIPNLPAEDLDEFVRDNTPARPNDPADRVVDGKYQRPLIDYDVFFHDMHAQIASLNDQISAATTDLALTKKLQGDTEREVQSRTEHIDKVLKPELEESRQELALITAHRDALTERLADTAASVTATLAENQQLSVRWTAWQLGAAQRLNELIDGEQAAAAR